jgi:hypothetical protein
LPWCWRESLKWGSSWRMGWPLKSLHWLKVKSWSSPRAHSTSSTTTTAWELKCTPCSTTTTQAPSPSPLASTTLKTLMRRLPHMVCLPTMWMRSLILHLPLALPRTFHVWRDVRELLNGVRNRR